MSLTSRAQLSEIDTKVRFRRTGLVPMRTDNVWSAALSIAENHASKIACLQDAGHTTLVEGHVRRLNDDVAEFKQAFRGQHPNEDAFFQALDDAATPVPISAPKSSFVRDDAVRMENGFTGRVSHDYASPRGDVRMVAVRVTRTSSDPDRRHGPRWDQQWHIREELLTRISDDQLEEYPDA